MSAATVADHRHLTRINTMQARAASATCDLFRQQQPQGGCLALNAASEASYTRERMFISQALSFILERGSYPRSRTTRGRATLSGNHQRLLHRSGPVRGFYGAGEDPYAPSVNIDLRKGRRRCRTWATAIPTRLLPDGWGSGGNRRFTFNGSCASGRGQPYARPLPAPASAMSTGRPMGSVKSTMEPGEASCWPFAEPGSLPDPLAAQAAVTSVCSHR
jgi:hypothetical protein